MRFSFARLFRRLGIHPMVLYSISSTAEIRTIETRIPVVSSEVTPKNVQDVRDMRDGPVGKKFRKFLAEGDTGLYAMLGTKVIGHVWSRVCTGARRSSISQWSGRSTGETIFTRTCCRY